MFSLGYEIPKGFQMNLKENIECFRIGFPKDLERWLRACDFVVVSLCSVLRGVL